MVTLTFSSITSTSPFEKTVTVKGGEDSINQATRKIFGGQYYSAVTSDGLFGGWVVSVRRPGKGIEKGNIVLEGTYLVTRN